MTTRGRAIILREMKNKKMALVCSGGGALGMAHVGVLAELEKDGREYSFFAGVSAGAIVCAMRAVGMTTQEVYDFMINEDLFSLSLDFTRSTGALFEGEKLIEIMEKVLGNKKFEDLDVPLFIGTTDFMTGERVVLSRGKIVDAVRASCGVPAVFRPFWHKGEKRWLVDGGLTQNFPLDIAIEKFKGEMITGIDLNGSLRADFPFARESRLGSPKDIPETIARMVRIMFRAQQARMPQDERVVMYLPDLAEYSSLDIRKSVLEKIYEKGRECVLNKD